MHMTDEYVNNVLSDAQKLLWSGSLHEMDEAHNMLVKLILEKRDANHTAESGQMSSPSATIGQLNKGEQMETTMTADQLIQENAGLKTTLSDTMNHVEYQRNKINELQSKVNKIIDNLTEDYWFNPNTDSETILSDICDILDYEPKKEISFTATFTVSGRYDIPMTDVEDFDLEAFLADTMSIDAYNGDVVIDDWSLESVDERY